MIFKVMFYEKKLITKIKNIRYENILIKEKVLFTNIFFKFVLYAIKTENNIQSIKNIPSTKIELILFSKKKKIVRKKLKLNMNNTSFRYTS